MPRKLTRTACAVTVTTALTLGAAPLALAAERPDPATSTAPATALPAADTAALARIAEGYLQQRADTVTATGRSRITPAVPQQAEAALRTELRKEFTGLAEQGRAYVKASGGYTHAKVKITPGAAELRGDTATLKITEDTSLFYPDAPEDAPEAEEYSLTHTLTFKRTAAGAWLLASDKPDIDTGDVTTYLATPAEGRTEPDSEDKGAPAVRASLARPTTPPEPKAMASYNYSKMVAYANKYWKHPNDDYRTYGNDCTNFISQSMYAGGWKPVGGSLLDRKKNSKWFYGPQPWTSYTWAGAENWYFFAQVHSKRTKPLRDIWALGTADVLQADWGPRPNNNIDHSMIVTKITRTERYLTYHTGNTHNRKLSNLIAKRPDAWYYAHRT
ncbi:amidase domain-containing protein [Streptomyces sp. C36]|uniref:amidase domain-containing protein n=1 Tax=Streptomyces sp. C36 TaxID=3237122 RepID=UPI0034C65C1D